MINGFVKGQSLKIAAPTLVADSIKYLEAKFHFQTSDWDGLSKWAHFSKGDTIYDIRLNEDDAITRSENLNLSAGEWAVYIHGTSADGVRITTEKAFIEVKESGVLDGEPFPDVPLTALEQLDNRVSNLERNGTGGGCETNRDVVYFGSGTPPKGYQMQIDPEAGTDDIIDFRELIKPRYNIEVNSTGEDSVFPFVDFETLSNEDKEALAQNTASMLQTPVFGSVTSDYKIVLSGKLSAGEYEVGFENEDGTTTYIGDYVRQQG